MTTRETVSNAPTAAVRRAEEVRGRRVRDLVGVGAGAAGLLAAGWAAATGALDGIEEPIFRALNAIPDWVSWITEPIMQLGMVLAVPTIAAIWIAKWRMWRPATGLLVGGGLTWLLAKVVKAVVDRGRPADLLADVALRNAPATGIGFPSGHAATVALMATVMSPYLPRRWKVVAWSLVGIVGLARIYVGAHMPWDVIGGWAFGIMAGGIVNLAIGVPVVVDENDEPSEACITVSERS